jgi:predicted nucleic acid-binding protein
LRIVLDSSALAKRYFEESGSAEVEEALGQASALGLSVICFPEIVSALNRRLREGILSPAEYQSAKTRLVADIQDATMLNLTPTVIGRATILLERHPIRAMDALHVACAIAWDADLFVSADRRQAMAAENTGMKVQTVGQSVWRYEQ